MAVRGSQSTEQSTPSRARRLLPWRRPRREAGLDPGGFSRVLRAKGVLPLALASVVARLPTGMSAISLILFVEHEVGSFAAAGLVAAAYSVGLGGTAPILGRIVDSRGRGILLPAAIVSALALVGVVALGDLEAPIWAIIAVAGLAGLATPPLGGVMRHRLPDLADRRDMPTAYALDSILIELIFILGPLLAALLSATAGPDFALFVAALAGVTGTIWFFLQLPGRESAGRAAARPRGGALSSPAVRVLVLACVPVGATFGVLEVALPAFGAAHGSASLGGALGAALAFGSVAGGIAYGLRPRALGPPELAVVRLSVLELILLLPLLIDVSVAAMFVLVTISGAPAAPLLSARNELVREALPPGTGIEAFSWITVSITVGASVGSALAGGAVELGGWQMGVALACLSSLIGLLIVISSQHRFRAGPIEDPAGCA